YPPEGAQVLVRSICEERYCTKDHSDALSASGMVPPVPVKGSQQLAEAVAVLRRGRDAGLLGMDVSRFLAAWDALPSPSTVPDTRGECPIHIEWDKGSDSVTYRVGVAAHDEQFGGDPIAYCDDDTVKPWQALVDAWNTAP